MVLDLLAARPPGRIAFSMASRGALRISSWVGNCFLRAE